MRSHTSVHVQDDEDEIQNAIPTSSKPNAKAKGRNFQTPAI
jgi:hypothetical protein